MKACTHGPEVTCLNCVRFVQSKCPLHGAHEGWVCPDCIRSGTSSAPSDGAVSAGGPCGNCGVSPGKQHYSWCQRHLMPGTKLEPVGPGGLAAAIDNLIRQANDAGYYVTFTLTPKGTIK